MADGAKLYALAIYDDISQGIMNEYRGKMIAEGYMGSQTAGIPHHMTLGSFPLDMKDRLASAVLGLNGMPEFDVEIGGASTFGDRVLFLEPRMCPALFALRARFEDGFPWAPHTTMFLSDDGGAIKAKSALEKAFAPFRARVSRVELYEFFPSKFICAQALKREALLVFIDGTICDDRHRLDLYGTEAFNSPKNVLADAAVPGSVECLRSLSGKYDIVYLGARDAVQKPLTESWLKSRGFPEGEVLLARENEERLELCRGRAFAAGISDRWDDSAIHQELNIRSIIIQEYEGNFSSVERWLK